MVNYPYIFKEIIITPNQENLYVCSKLYEIGEQFATPIIELYPSHNLEMTHSSDLSRNYKMQVHNNLYYVSINRKNIVNYIAINDSSFKTEDKLKVGSSMSDVRDITKSEVRQLPGWGYFVPLPSGWNAGFCGGQSCTSDSLIATSQIDWFFKADWFTSKEKQ